MIVVVYQFIANSARKKILGFGGLFVSAAVLYQLQGYEEPYIKSRTINCVDLNSWKEF